MSRSGYTDDCDGDYWSLIRWRGAVKSAARGARGQAFFRELRDALDAMPVKRLIANELATPTGEFCTLGVLGERRGIDMSELDPEDRQQVSAAFGIADALAAEVVFQNDEGCDRTPEGRWTRMREWVEQQITKATPTTPEASP